MREKIIFIRDFLLKGIWSIRLSDLHPRKAKIFKSVRILILSIRGFNEDRIQLRSSALTLYTLLSVVPILALGFGIAKGFGYDKFLQNQILSNLQEHKEVINWLITFANTLLDNTRGGVVAGIGLILLFWTVMKVFMNIELSFNDIWQVKKSRPFTRKFSDYLSMMFISPIFFITASASNVYINQVLSTMDDRIKILGYISPFLFFLIKLIPYFLIIVMFTLFYIIMPNTRVKFIPGVTGGIIAGTLFLLIQWAYVYFQIGVSRYNAIYGSFAALPLFIIWVQLSWQIVLFGAKIAYSTQNVDMYEFETETVHMSDYSRRILSMLLVHRTLQNFTQGLKPLTAEDLSQELRIPIRMIKALLYDLVQCNILSEVTTPKPKVMAYQPAQYIERFTIKFVMESLDKQGENYVEEHDSDIARKLLQIHDKFFTQIEDMSENIQLKDL